jgi:hypothetical protein
VPEEDFLRQLEAVAVGTFAFVLVRRSAGRR